MTGAARPPARAPARPDDPGEAAARRAHYDDPAAVERAMIALDAGRMGAWGYHVPSETVTGDPFVARLLALDYDAQPWPSDAVFASMHPDDRPRVEAEVARAFATDAPYEVIFRDRIADPATGEPGLRWLGARGRVTERDAEGAPVTLIGVNWDATAEVEHETALKEHARELDHRVKNALASMRGLTTLAARADPACGDTARLLAGQITALSAAHEAASARADGRPTAGAVLRAVARSTRCGVQVEGPDGPPLAVSEANALAALMQVSIDPGAATPLRAVLIDEPDGAVAVTLRDAARPATGLAATIRDRAVEALCADVAGDGLRLRFVPLARRTGAR